MENSRNQSLSFINNESLRESRIEQKEKNKKNGPLKRSISSCFFITVSNISDKHTKKFTFDALAPKARELVVAEEIHKNGKNHHHLCIRMIQKVNEDEMRKIIDEIYLDVKQENVFFEPVRNFKDTIRYATKYDHSPLHKNVNESCFSFYYKIYHWSQRTSKFSYADPFVLNARRDHNLVNLAYQDFKVERFRLKSLKPLVVLKRFNNWRDEVIDWYNDWVNNGYSHKKKQLYLFGESNTGKTYFINEIIGQYGQQIFTPSANDDKYAWEQFDERKHNFVRIDEFSFNNYDFNLWKVAVSGENLTTCVKFKASQTKNCKVPMVFISNDFPPIEKVGFKERVLIVRAVGQVETDNQLNYADYFQTKNDSNRSRTSSIGSFSSKKTFNSSSVNEQSQASKSIKITDSLSLPSKKNSKDILNSLSNLKDIEKSNSFNSHRFRKNPSIESCSLSDSSQNSNDSQSNFNKNISENISDVADCSSIDSIFNIELEKSIDSSKKRNRDVINVEKIFNSTQIDQNLNIPRNDSIEFSFSKQNKQPRNLSIRETSL